MCDGFSEAFLAAASGSMAAASATAGASTTMAAVGAGIGSAVTAVGGYAGVAALGSAAMSGYSAMQQADAQQKTSNYQAQVDANNATIAMQQRTAAINQGQQEAQQTMLHEAATTSQQKADLTANGVSLGSGSALDQLATTKFLGNQDINAITTNAARTAWGYGVQAQSATAQSNLERWKAKNNSQLAIGAMSAGSSLLSSATSYAMAKR